MDASRRLYLSLHGCLAHRAFDVTVPLLYQFGMEPHAASWRYIQGIPSVNPPSLYYGPNVYADHQAVKEHFCSFWKRELGLSSTERVKLEEIFDRGVTVAPHFASNTSYLIFTNENNVISIQSMEDAIFDALNLAQ